MNHFNSLNFNNYDVAIKPNLTIVNNQLPHHLLMQRDQTIFSKIYSSGAYALGLVPSSGDVVTKINYLILSNAFYAFMHPFQSFNALRDLFIEERLWRSIEHHESPSYKLGNHPLLQIQRKELSPVENALNDQLKTVDWNQWISPRWQFNVNDLGRFASSNNEIRHMSNENLYKFLKNISACSQLALEVISQMKENHQFGPQHIDLIKKLHSLKNDQMDFFTEEIEKIKFNVFISGDNSAYIENKICGKGSYKIVFEAKDVRRKEKVAICISHLQNETERKMIYKGLKIIKKLQHIEGIIQLKGCYTNSIGKSKSNTLLFIVQEFCEEGNLYQHFGKLSLINKIDISLQVLKLVKLIHDEGYVLGDLKAENILLKKDPITQKFIVRISDFDMSHKINKGVKKGGSILFMSPERIALNFNLSNLEVAKSFTQVECEIFETGLLLLELFESDGQYMLLPWDEKEIFNLIKKNNLNELKNNFQTLIDDINQNLDHSPLKKIYEILTAMLNPYSPDLRPNLDHVIKVFEDVEQVIDFDESNSQWKLIFK